MIVCINPYHREIKTHNNNNNLTIIIINDVQQLGVMGLGECGKQLCGGWPTAF